MPVKYSYSEQSDYRLICPWKIHALTFPLNIMLYWFLNVTKRTCNYLAQKKTALDLSINRGDRRLIIRNDSSQTFFHKLWKRKKKENKNNLTAANQIKEDNTKYFLLLSDRLFLCIPISHIFYFVFLFIKSNKNYFFWPKCLQTEHTRSHLQKQPEI